MFSEEIVKEYEQKAAELLKEKDLYFLPIDIAKLVNDNDFLVQKMVLDNDTAGMLLVDDKNTILNTGSNKIIILNKNCDYEKLRFITAHEFAHFILHKKLETQFAHRDIKNQSSKEEYEADFFSRCLLMPRDLILQNIKNFKELKQNLTYEEIIEYIAKISNVNLKKARIRFEELQGDIISLGVGV